ncbi:MAG TPA: acyl-CoA dehydrogenase family protein [Nocardioidaceae bacterium]|nr:acyl-CoA dehydrogenase family protein [Nocardioidaceae bacterium]
MRFTLTDEQSGFARSIDDLLSGAGVPAVIRSWAAGDSGPGLKLWDRLADLGVTSLCDPDVGATPADVVVAFEQLGRHAVPGPWVESAVVVPSLLGHAVEGIATFGVPLALDADIADVSYCVAGESLCTAEPGDLVPSIDPARRLFQLEIGDPVAALDSRTEVQALDLATLAVSAQLVGAGYRVLEDAVEYAKARVQFGKPIGQQQAVKHLLADAKVALDFARPLVWGAALSVSPRDVSAAKVAAGDAAYAASRAALQAHGAIGYTEEYDLSLWLLKIRALRSAWGSPSYHRGRVLDALVSQGTEA